MKVGFEVMFALAASSSVFLVGCDDNDHDHGDDDHGDDQLPTSSNSCPPQAVIHIRIGHIATMPMTTLQEQCASMDAMIALHNEAAGCDYNDIVFDAAVANSPVQAAKVSLGCSPGSPASPSPDCLSADAVTERAAEISALSSSTVAERCTRMEALVALNNELDGCQHNGLTFDAAAANKLLSMSLLGCPGVCPYDPCNAASAVQVIQNMVGKNQCELWQINIDCTKAGGACEGADQSVADAAVAVYEAAKPSDC